LESFEDVRGIWLFFEIRCIFCSMSENR